MQNVLLISVLVSSISITSFAQCDSLTISDFDKVTGNSFIVSARPIIVTKDSVNVISIYFRKELKKFKDYYPLNVFLKAFGASNCVEDSGVINFLFRDGTRLEIKNMGEYNCENSFLLQFLIGPRAGRRPEIALYLRTKEIETIRIWTSSGFVQQDLSPTQSRVFLKTFDCLFKP